MQRKDRRGADFKFRNMNEVFFLLPVNATAPGAGPDPAVGIGGDGPDKKIPEALVGPVVAPLILSIAINPGAFRPDPQGSVLPGRDGQHGAALPVVGGVERGQAGAPGDGETARTGSDPDVALAVFVEHPDPILQRRCLMIEDEPAAIRPDQVQAVIHRGIGERTVAQLKRNIDLARAPSPAIRRPSPVGPFADAFVAYNPPAAIKRRPQGPDITGVLCRPQVDRTELTVAQFFGFAIGGDPDPAGGSAGEPQFLGLFIMVFDQRRPRRFSPGQ